MELIFHSNGRQTSKVLVEGQSILVGRNLSGMNGVTLVEEGVSANHASISLIGGKIKVSDLGSTNGTYVDGTRIASGAIATATNEIRLGPVKIEIRRPQSSRTSNQSGGSTSLEALLTTKQQIVIGRMTDCDIVLNESTVSKRHARVFKKDGVVYVEDLGSTNGIFKNRHRIKGKTTLGLNDILSIGLTTFQLGHETKNYSGYSAVSITGVGKVFPEGKVGLQPMSMDIPSGSFVAMMGPSGCGKSTLLKTLNGDAPASSGIVKIFGRELRENYDELKQLIGYVPQDDIVHRELTVDETLYYAAKLRLSPDISEEKIKERIDSVLATLNINDPKDRQNRVEKLSGGQRKRISIAVELLSNPKILLLDEPTSPLDPETINDFLKCLQNLCNNGTTVIMVTHKPEDLKFADQVVFLGSGGYHVYYGSAVEYKSYFNKNEILDIYTLLSDKAQSVQWYKRWTRNQPPILQTSPQKIKQQTSVDFFHQLYWLTVRYLMVKMGNTQNMIIVLIQPLIIALLLMAVYSNLITEVTGVPDPNTTEFTNSFKSGNAAVIFLMAIAAIWFGVSNSAKEIVGEGSIFRRERMYNLKLRTYVLSKWLILMLISFVQLVIFLTLLKIYYGSDLVALPETLLFLILLSSGSILFGLLLSSCSKTIDAAMSYLPIALMPQIILSGVLSNLSNKGTEFLSYLTFGRWGTEGLARIQDEGLKKTVYLIEKKVPNNLWECLYKDGDLMKLFEGLQENIIAIIILSVIFLALTFLRLMNFDQRFDQAQLRK